MPRRTLGLGAILALLAVAGCGGGSDADPDQQQVGTVAKQYLEAVADEDWTAVCETRSQKERDEAEDFAGSCERVMERAFRDIPRDSFDGARLGDIRIDGDTAEVDVYQRGRDEISLTLTAVRERGGDWRLQATPEAERP
jgi:hypothetical protein